MAGELWIAGVQVGLGYANRAELTAERFVDDPFVSGERMYRTGDLGRFLDDGVIEYLGRIDQQVKIRGLRIELGEIESALCGLEGVKEAAVLAREDVPGVKRLVGYVVPRAGAGREAVEAGALKAGLMRTLPEYMVPAAWVVLESFPTTTSGKLDRKQLPPPKRGGEEGAVFGSSRVHGATSEESGMTRTQRELMRIWGEVLRTDRVGLDENFFEIGGDSILSIQISARARRVGIGITPNDVFEHPTIRDLSLAARVVESTVLPQQAVVGECGLVPEQRWLLGQDLVNVSHWNAAILVECPAGLATDALRAGVRAVVAHHDALRLRFWEEGGAWRSAYTSAEGVGPELLEYVAKSVGELDELIAEVGDRLQRSLDLVSGRCSAAAVFRCAGLSTRLLLVAHHLVLDGFSWRVIVEDVQQAESAAARGETVLLPPKTASLAQWAVALAVEAHGIARDGRERAAWARLIAVSGGVVPDRPGADNRGHSLASVVVELDEATTGALLHKTPAASGVQVQEILLGALGAAMREDGSSGALRIDMLGHGREALSTELDISRTVGWLTSVFPVVLDVDRMSSAAASVAAAAEALRVVPRRGLSYGLLRYLGDDVTREALSAAGPDVSFNHLGQFDQALAPGWSLRVARSRCGVTRDESSQRPYAIEVDAMVVGGRLVLETAYSAARFDRSRVERWSGKMLETVRAFVASPSVAAAPSRRFAKSGLSGTGLAGLSALFDSADPDGKSGA